MTDRQTETRRAELVPSGDELVYSRFLWYDAQEGTEGRARRDAWTAAWNQYEGRCGYMVSLALDDRTALAIALGWYDAGSERFPWVATIQAEAGGTCRTLTAQETRDILRGASLGGQTAMAADLDPDRGMGPRTAVMELDLSPSYCVRWTELGRLLNLIAWPDDAGHETSEGGNSDAGL